MILVPRNVNTIRSNACPDSEAGWVFQKCYRQDGAKYTNMDVLHL